MAGPTENCEEILRAGIRYNVDHGILRSENVVAERLLARRTELVEAYDELHAKLQNQPQALKAFFGALLSTAAFWNPDKLANARKGRSALMRSTDPSRQRLLSWQRSSTNGPISTTILNFGRTRTTMCAMSLRLPRKATICSTAGFVKNLPPLADSSI